MASSEDILMQFVGEDNVSSVVSSIESSVSGTISNISSMFDSINESVMSIVSSVDVMNESLSNIENPLIDVEVDDSQIDDTLSKEDELNNETETTVNVDDSQIDDAISKKEDLDKDTNIKVNVNDTDLSDLSAGLSALGGVAGMAGLDEMMDTAGRISDSWNRLDLTFGGVSDNLKRNISEVASATGRSGATTRNYFNMMGIAGVTNTEKIGQSFEAMAGFAYQSGKDVNTLSASMQRMVMAGTANARMLGSMGISMKDLGDAMGVSADEVTKAFKALTPEERMEALVKVMGDGTKANEMYKNSWEGTKEKASAEFAGLMGAIGTPILQFMIPIMHQLTGIVETITGTFKSLPAPIQTAIGGILAGAVGLTSFASMVPAFTKAINGLKTGFSTLGNVVGKLPGIGSKFASFGKQTKEVVDTAEGVGGLAGKANTASTGMKTTSVTLRGIGQGAMAMLAPLIEISIVIAVMIPIIAGLVAEALLFIKGLQILIDALDFDSINLDGAIEGIKQVATAIAYVGVAMGAMTFSNIMTATALLTSALTGVINPIQVAGALLKQASEEIAKLGLANIDPSVADKIRKVSESLKLVGDAMGSLTNLTVDMAMGNIMTLGGLLGNISSAITTAREEIVHAGQEISQIKNLPDIDQSAVDKLKKISESIKSVSDAFDGLRSIRDNANWDVLFQGLFGGMDIETAINSIKDDIVKAGNSLSQLTGLPDIPDGVGDRLRKIADSVKSVSDAMGSLRSIRDNSNWDMFMQGLFGGMDIQTVFNNVRNDLYTAGNTLSSFTGLPEIPDGIPTKVNRIADSTKTVGNALTQMQNANIPNIVTLALMPVKIAMAKMVLQNIANQINQLTGLPQIQEGIGAKVTSVANTTRVVGNALTQMQGANIPNVVSLMLLPIRIAMAKMVLQSTATQLNSLQGIPNVPEGLGVKLNNVAMGTRGVASAVSAINSIPMIGPEAGMKVGMAVSAIKRAMTELQKLQGGQGVNVAGVVASVRNALNQVRATLGAMQGGFRGSAVGLGSSIVSGVRSGMAGLGGAVSSSVSSGIGSARGTAHSGGQQLGSNATNGFRDSLKLADIARDEMNYAVQAVNSGAGALADATRRAAEQAVQAAKQGAEHQSPGAIARMWGQEIGGYSVDKVLEGSKLLIKTVYDVSRRVVNAWGNPQLNEVFGMNNNLLNPNMINGINNLASNNLNIGNGGGKVIVFNFSEGAIPIDARNFTEKEAKQMMILGLENLDMISNIDIRGV